MHKYFFHINVSINVLQISEAENELKQKVASLSQQEKKYESLEEELDVLKDKCEEKGRLLHIASDRVTEVREGDQDGEEKENGEGVHF